MLQARFGNGLGSLARHGVRGVAGGLTLAAIRLAQTSLAGTNPPEWDSDFDDYLLWDGGTNTGDKHLLRWRRVNGGAWTTEAEQTLDFAMLSGGFTWPLLEATKPLAGGYFEAQEQRVRYVGGVEALRSPFSNPVVDNLAGAAFAPSSLYGAGDIGYAWDTTDLTHIWQSNAGTGAGAFTSPVGRIDDKSGLGNNWNSDFNTTDRPTLANTNNGLITFTGASNTRLKNIGGFRTKGAMTWIGVVKGAASSNFVWAETSTSAANPVYAPGLRGDTAALMFNYQRNDAATALVTAMAAALLDGAIHVYMVEDTGTVLTLWLDGVQTASAAYARNGATTLTNSWLGVADNAGGFFGPFTGSIGSGIVISRQLTGVLGTAGTEKTLAYNWVAAKHGLAQL